MHSASRHQCLIYDGPPSQHLRALATILGNKLAENHRCLYMNSPAMVAEMCACLAAAGIDVDREVATGSIVLSAGHDRLVDGRFDVDRMIRLLEDAIEDAVRNRYRGLWATGDMTWELGPQNDYSQLLEYEWRLEQLFRRNGRLSGICQYHRDTLPGRAMRCALISHGSVFLSETLSRINPHFVDGEPSARSVVMDDPHLDEAVLQLSQAND